MEKRSVRLGLKLEFLSTTAIKPVLKFIEIHKVMNYIEKNKPTFH